MPTLVLFIFDRNTLRLVGCTYLGIMVMFLILKTVDFYVGQCPQALQGIPKIIEPRPPTLGVP